MPKFVLSLHYVVDSANTQSNDIYLLEDRPIVPRKGEEFELPNAGWFPVQNVYHSHDRDRGVKYVEVVVRTNQGVYDDLKKSRKFTDDLVSMLKKLKPHKKPHRR